METFLLDWALLLVRWLHVIVGIAWIGASFYFVWLDNSLLKPRDPEVIKRGVDGELWAVHGGGFYNPQKYMVAPPNLPNNLHWFYWESYSTWLSGFAMFVLLYLINPRAYLIDPQVYPLSPTIAVVGALAFLACGWIVYDGICRVFGQDNRKVGILTALVVIASAYVASRFFASRAAFLLTGAMMATIMTANVFFLIIPGQRKVIASMQAGEPVDPIHGKRGKQRSVHNSYFTLPVLLSMLSNHYTILTSHAYNWILLLLLMVASVLIRHFFLLRHKNVLNWWFPAAGAAIIVAVIMWTAPFSKGESSDLVETAVTVPLEVTSIVKERCAPCHSMHPTILAIAPKDMVLDLPEQIFAHRQLIYQKVVIERSMPVGNLTKMSDPERDVIKSWYEGKGH